MTLTLTPLEQEMFHQDSMLTPRVYLRPNENVHIPFKYQTFLCGHALPSQVNLCVTISIPNQVYYPLHLNFLCTFLSPYVYRIVSVNWDTKLTFHSLSLRSQSCSLIRWSWKTTRKKCWIFNCLYVLHCSSIQPWTMCHQWKTAFGLSFPSSMMRLGLVCMFPV